MTERLDPYEIFTEDDIELDLPRSPRAGGSRPAPPLVPPRHVPGGAAERQRTCAACGAAFEPGQRTELEVLIDGEVRYVAVHSGHTTHAPAGERMASSRLRTIRPEATTEARDAAA